MAAKQQPKGSIASPRADTPESGVQLSRRALYEQRVAEIDADVAAGHCTPQEADERTIQALLALHGRVLAPAGKQELTELLRELASTHPALRQTED